MEGVWEKRLKVLPDERGRLMEILRNDEEIFSRFGQVYITTVWPGVVKAWHAHERQRDYLGCVVGMIKLVLFKQETEEIREYFIGEHNPLLISIPPGIWHGFKGCGDTEAVIINCPDSLYNYNEPDELRLDPHSGRIPYDWSRRDG